MKREFFEKTNAILPLPWPFEVAIFVISVVCIPIGMWWFIGEVTGPALNLGKVFGVSVDVQPLVDAVKPITLAFGLMIGIKVWISLRKFVQRKLDSII